VTSALSVAAVWTILFCFPSVAPDKGPAQAVWGKWWSRYLRRVVGIVDPNKVFHSFRHKFSDGATRAGVDPEIRKALMGHSDASISGGYGSAAMLERFGVKALAEAVTKISYPGLDLSRVRTKAAVRRTRADTRQQMKPMVPRGPAAQREKGNL
jgi:hypothetical protein